MVALKYVVVGVVVVVVIAAALTLLLPTQHKAPVQYVGSPSGYEAFVPSGQTINYNGHTDPTGTLILPDGKTIEHVVWDGQYANTIIQIHDQIVQLNNQFVGRTDPVNGQPYVPLQDFIVIKGPLPVQQVTINGQTYYIIQASSINPQNIAAFDTYKAWIPSVVVAMNTPGTYAAALPGNSPVFQWGNLTGTVAYQTMLYEHYGPFAGGYVLVLPTNGTIIPYGVNTYIEGSSFNKYILTPVYNSSS